MVNGLDIVNYAKTFLGVRYVFGGSSPNGFDCSGLVQYIYKHFGINISRTTKTQINDGREVGRNNLQLGDLVFSDSGHVTLYIGNNQVIHAPQPGEVVKISNIWKFWRARRILSDNQNQTFSTPAPLPTITHNNIGEFKLQTPTLLHKTGESFSFLLGDYNHNGCLDLYAISKSQTGSKSTEVHILSGKNNFQSWLLNTGTKLHETGNNWTFLLGDYNHDGCLDLYAICKNQTGSKSTEVHILSGKNNFQSWLLNTGTILHETDDNWDFCLGDYNNDGNLDLYAIAKRNTGSKSTEVHILSGKNNFQSWLLNTGTILHETDDNWAFGVSNYTGQGNKDLYCIAKRCTGSKSTEIHILNGSNNFKSWLLQTGTKLHETGKNFSFCAHENSLFVIKKEGGSNSTEVHCLNV